MIRGTRNALTVCRAHGASLYAGIVTLHNCFGRCRMAVVNANSHQRAAALHTFSVGTRFIFVVAGLRERSNQTAGSTACSSHGRCRGEPPSRNNRPNAGNGQHAEASEKTGNTAKGRTDTRAGGRAFGPIIAAIMIPIDARCGAVPVEPATFVIRHDADVVVWDASPFQLVNDTHCGIVIFVEARNRFHAVLSFSNVSEWSAVDYRLGAPETVLLGMVVPCVPARNTLP